MKTLEQIIKSKPIYLHDWAVDKKFQLVMDFEDYDRFDHMKMSKDEYNAKECPWANKEMWLSSKIKTREVLNEWKNIKILFATYTYANYSGDAFVLFEKNGKLYEVNGSHCSCYGLEGQWSPEEVNLKELYNRITGGSFGVGYYGEEDEFEFKNELAKFLGIKLSEITYHERD